MERGSLRKRSLLQTTSLVEVAASRAPWIAVVSSDMARSSSVFVAGWSTGHARVASTKRIEYSDKDGFVMKRSVRGCDRLEAYVFVHEYAYSASWRRAILPDGLVVFDRKLMTRGEPCFVQGADMDFVGG